MATRSLLFGHQPLDVRLPFFAESLASRCGSVFLCDGSIDIPIWVYGLAVGACRFFARGRGVMMPRLNEIVVNLPDFWVESMA